MVFFFVGGGHYIKAFVTVKFPSNITVSTIFTVSCLPTSAAKTSVHQQRSQVSDVVYTLFPVEL